MISITPLEAWIKQKADIGNDMTDKFFLDALKRYQLQKVNEIIDYACNKTAFYRRHFATIPTFPLAALPDIARIPLTTSSDLINDPLGFLAVSPDAIAKIVTLRTSGSTGKPKRIFFTEDDIELTVDFFHYGMSTIVRPGQRVAVLLPAEKPDSVGDLLIRGLKRMDVHALAYGPVADPFHAAQMIASFGAHCLVGIPTQVLAVAHSWKGNKTGKSGIESVLLSTDYTPRAIMTRLEEIWGCRVFTHYGMTEMGLGGGVECEALDGYHLREADLYFEVVDHETGVPCPEGVIGEAVFTTLTRRGMPLIRYKTGDIARIIPEPCPCGTVLRRMERVKGRWDNAVCIAPGYTLTIPEMDEALFRLQGLLDYRASVSKVREGTFQLDINIYKAENSSLRGREVLRMLNEICTIRECVASTRMEIPTVHFSEEGRWNTTGTSKRKIIRVSEVLI